MTKRRIATEPRRFWTDAEHAQFVAQYPHMQTKAIAAMLERPIKAVYARAKAYGLSKSAEYLASPLSGRTNGRQGLHTRFQRGNTAWNKGTHWKAGGRSPETRFKPGTRSGKAAQHYMPVGSTRQIEGYELVKVADVPNVAYTVNWIASHILMWERANGPKPDGHAIVFRNGDRTDLRLDNLELVTRKELLARNWHRRYPKEIRQITQLRGAITRQINKRTRNEQRD